MCPMQAPSFRLGFLDDRWDYLLSRKKWRVRSCRVEDSGNRLETFLDLLSRDLHKQVGISGLGGEGFSQS